MTKANLNRSGLLNPHMNIKIKTQEKDLLSRQEIKTKVHEIMIHEDFLNPKNETIAVGFAQGTTSGLVEFSAAEFEKLYLEVKSRIHLIKGMKKFSSDDML